MMTPPASAQQNLAPQDSVPQDSVPQDLAHTPLSDTTALPDSGGPVELPLWQRTLYKTITYQAAANAADVIAFDLLVGGTAATTTGFFVTNAVSAAVIYYGFEYAWQSFGPSLDETTERTVLEKTALYRFINIGRNFTLGYTFGGGTATASAFAAANLVYDTAIFASNEYMWDVLRPQKAP